MHGAGHETKKVWRILKTLLENKELDPEGRGHKVYVENKLLERELMAL